MRTAEITLNGKNYPLCFSARTVRACTDRYGDLGKIGERLTAGNLGENMEEALWLLSAMLDAGSRYAKLNGNDIPEPPSLEELYDLCGMEEFNGLASKLMETMNRSGGAQVAAVADSKTKRKNGEAAPAAP